MHTIDGADGPAVLSGTCLATDWIALLTCETLILLLGVRGAPLLTRAEGRWGKNSRESALLRRFTTFESIELTTQRTRMTRLRYWKLIMPLSNATTSRGLRRATLAATAATTSRISWSCSGVKAGGLKSCCRRQGIRIVDPRSSLVPGQRSAEGWWR